MNLDWAQIIKITLSCFVGGSVILGCSIWFNYDVLDNPRDRYKRVIIGLILIAIGVGVATGYHYTAKSGNLPRFLVLTEAEKAQERAEEEKRAIAEEKARKKKEAEEKDVAEETGITGMVTHEVQSNKIVDKVEIGTVVETVTPGVKTNNSSEKSN